MDRSLFNYPIEPILSACRTLFGRVILFFVALALGCGFGGLTASGELVGFFVGVAGMPMVLMIAAYYSYGLLLTPLSFAILIAIVRLNLKEYWFILPLIFFWVMTHDYFNHRMNKKNNLYMDSVGEGIVELYDQI